MDKLREADTVIDCLGKAMLDGTAGLSSVPGLLLRVIRENLWQERVIIRTGEVVRFERFEEFVRTKPLEGLGTDIKTLMRLCGDNTEVQAELVKVVKALPGAPSGNQNAAKTTVDNINSCFVSERPTGTSRAYALRKLETDSPELYTRVVAGELSPNAAMVEAGFRRKTITVPVDDIDALARRLRKALTEDDIAALIDALESE